MKKPIPYTPKEIRISGNVGIYSVIVSSGEGIKPVTTIPIPFSIQIETNTAIQAKINVLSFCLVLGNRSKRIAVNAKITENHINGTSAVFSSKPKNRYWKWCMC